MRFSLDLLMEVTCYSICLWRHSEPTYSAIIIKQEAFCLSQLYCVVISECLLNSWKDFLMWMDFP